VKYEKLEGNEFPKLYDDQVEISNFKDIFKYLKNKHKFTAESNLNEFQKIEFESFSILLMEEFLPCVNYYFYNEQVNASIG
jgi:hypothetical protein